MSVIALLEVFMFHEEELEVETQAAVDHRRSLEQRERTPLRAGKATGRRPYTPQFSPRATVTVRRLAWALQVSMPKAVDRAVNALPSIFSPSVVCPLCKDQTKCAWCAINPPSAAEAAAPAV
jgi:hypothetical protein